MEFLFHKVTKSDSTSATSNERILQRVTSEVLQQATSATSNGRILQRVTSDFLQRATSATSNEQILQRVTSNDWISTSNEQQVKSYISNNEWKVTPQVVSCKLFNVRPAWVFILLTSDIFWWHLKHYSIRHKPRQYLAIFIKNIWYWSWTIFDDIWP